MAFFSQNDLAGLNRGHFPKHIAIIPDGNRRWAKQKRFSVEEGHAEGADNLMDIVQGAYELGVKILTFYIFSTENWNRPQLEVQAFMKLLEKYLIEKLPLMIKKDVRLGWIGNKERLSSSLLQTLDHCLKETAHCQNMELVLAINYGGRDEIIRAVKKLSSEKKSPQEIDEYLFSSYLDTSRWPDPDLLIRTSGEMRISNFLLWQLSYAEVYLSNTLWPDFTPHHLLEAVRQYSQRERRLGGG